MDGWNYYVKKKVFLILKNHRQYSGIIDSVENVGNGLLFINLIDKFGNKIMFLSGEVEVVQEERK